MTDEPVDEQFVHERLDRLETLPEDGKILIATRRQACDELDRIRAEVDPDRVACEVEGPRD